MAKVQIISEQMSYADILETADLAGVDLPVTGWSSWRWNGKGNPPIHSPLGTFTHCAERCETESGLWQGVALHIGAAPILFNGNDPAALIPYRMSATAIRARIVEFATKPQLSVSESYNLTDCGNAERLVAQFKDELRYCHDWQRWLVWDGARWVSDRDGTITKQTKAVARSILIEAASIEDDARRKETVKFAMRSEVIARQEAMAELAQHDLAVLPESLDSDQWLLNCQNGTLDLRTGKLRRPERDDLITKMAPVEYHPSAQCPQFIQFLSQVFAGNQPIIDFVQQAIGYALTGSTREQVVFILHGSGRNGKSTLLEAIAGLLGGDFAQQAAPDLLMQKRFDGHPTELAALRGARLVTAVESGEGRKLNEPLIKQMSGGDRIRARFMRADFFEFKPEFKLFLATNHRPEIRGTDLGIWRRIRLIPFDVQIPEADVDLGLPDKLRDEASGILAWAVAGCLAWQQAGRLVAPAEVTDATASYRAEQDVLAGFFADRCVMTANAKTKAADLFGAYVTWCEQTGERPETQRKLGNRLIERGFSKHRTMHGWFYEGIGLVDMNETMNDMNDHEPKTSIPLSKNEISRSETEKRFMKVHKVHDVEATRPATICSWDAWGDRLLTKCDHPEPNQDRTGCANCGASKPYQR